MTSVRLPREIEQKLEILSRRKHKTKSELINEALEQMFQNEEDQKDSFQIGESLFGLFGSGDGSLSTEYKSKLKDKIRAKRNSG